MATSDVTTQHTTPPTNPTAQTNGRVSPSEELRAVAVQQFASVGFAGTSLQQIADAAGYSKSSVLYHFASKEALLEAALTPAIDAFERLVDGVDSMRGTRTQRRRFIENFVDFLLEYRVEVATFINQGKSLGGIPVIDRANLVAKKLAKECTSDDASMEEQLSFGIALGGAAFALTADSQYVDDAPPPVEELRPALIAVMSQLLIRDARTTEH